MHAINAQENVHIVQVVHNVYVDVSNKGSTIFTAVRWTNFPEMYLNPCYLSTFYTLRT